jgi:hypothetical protein
MPDVLLDMHYCGHVIFYMIPEQQKKADAD